MKYLVPGMKYLVPGMKYLVPGMKYLDPEWNIVFNLREIVINISFRVHHRSGPDFISTSIYSDLVIARRIS